MKTFAAIVVVIIGIALVVYGIDHMNSTAAQIRTLLGEDDIMGKSTIGIGSILIVVGAILAVRK